MATEEDTAHPPEIAIHICPLCRKDIASGLDVKGFPAKCRACSPKPRARGRAEPQPEEQLKAIEDQLLAVSIGLSFCLCPQCRKQIASGLNSKGRPIKCRACSQKASARRQS
jgi:hypothetical protein